MPKRLTHEFVKQQFKKHGYKLLSEYQNTSTPLSFSCPNQHVHQIRYGQFIKKPTCAVCDGKVITAKGVEAAYSKEGYKLLEPYRGSVTDRLLTACDAGHFYLSTYHKFKQKRRCPYCAGKKINTGHAKRLLKQEGYELLSDEFHLKKGKYAKITFQCPRLHRHSFEWRCWHWGYRCKTCNTENHKIDNARAIALEMYREGYSLLSKTVGNKRNMVFTCKAGHERNISLGAWRSGQRCATCATSGYQSDKPGTLYYIAFDHPEFPTPLYKIGITNRTVQERFAPEPTPYRIIHTESYLFGFLAYEKEQRILAQHAAHKYTGANLLVSGNTELFTTDILNLDKAAHKQSPLPDRRSA